MRKVVGVRAGILVLDALLICCGVAGVLTLRFHGFVDFPCFVRYDRERKCVEIDPRTIPQWSSGPESAPRRIEAFLTVVEVGWSGGGCSYQHSNTDGLELQNPFTKVTLERVDDHLKVNDKNLAEDKEFKRPVPFTLNPWVLADLRFKNLGLVKYCEGNPEERIVVVGEYGTELTPLHGLAFLGVLVGTRLILARKLRKLRAFRASSQ